MHGDERLLVNLHTLSEGFESVDEDGERIKPRYVSVLLGQTKPEILAEAVEYAAAHGMELVGKSVSSKWSYEDFKLMHKVGLIKYALRMHRMALDSGVQRALVGADIAMALRASKKFPADFHLTCNGIRLGGHPSGHRVPISPGSASLYANSLVGGSEWFNSEHPLGMAFAYATDIRTSNPEFIQSRFGPKGPSDLRFLVDSCASMFRRVVKVTT